MCTLKVVDCNPYSSAYNTNKIRWYNVNISSAQHNFPPGCINSQFTWPLGTCWTWTRSVSLCVRPILLKPKLSKTTLPKQPNYWNKIVKDVIINNMNLWTASWIIIYRMVIIGHFFPHSNNSFSLTTPDNIQSQTSIQDILFCSKLTPCLELDHNYLFTLKYIINYLNSRNIL